MVSSRQPPKEKTAYALGGSGPAGHAPHGAGSLDAAEELARLNGFASSRPRRARSDDAIDILAARGQA